MGNDQLQALHRLDRVTAGLIMFSVNSDTRHRYHQLFKTRQIQKTYQAIARTDDDKELVGRKWEIRNRIVASDPRFLMRVIEGEPNSHSMVRCTEQATGRSLFELNPVTGRTHQLRVHMQALGWPILNDKYYPTLQPLTEDDYSAPLQLLATQLRFIDPVTHTSRHFFCSHNLSVE